LRKIRREVSLLKERWTLVGLEKEWGREEPADSYHRVGRGKGMGAIGESRYIVGGKALMFSRGRRKSENEKKKSGHGG